MGDGIVSGERGATGAAALEWDDYFMLLALVISLKSKDPASKVGCVVVDQDRHVVGTGYNGFVRGADETVFSWQKDVEWIHSKYPYVIHAEQNALIDLAGGATGCTLYSTLFPCHECAKIIAQKGVKRVVFLSNRYVDRDSEKAAAIIFRSSGVEVSQKEVASFESLARNTLLEILAPG